MAWPQAENAYRLHTLPGDWLEYAYWCSRPSLWLGLGVDGAYPTELPESGLLRAEIVGVGRETRLSSRPWQRTAFETPLCDLYLYGSRIIERARPPLLGQHVAYPVDSVFWGQLRTSESSAQGQSTDSPVSWDDAVVTLESQMVMPSAEPGVWLHLTYQQTIDRATGIMLQGLGITETGETCCVMLVNSSVKASAI
jgi:hypothetical protein